MTHPRALLRRAAQSQLLNRTPAFENVQRRKRKTYDRDELPVVDVYADTEEVDERSHETAPRELKRFPQLLIKGVLKETDNIVSQHDNDMEDALDEFALQIEAAVALDETLSGSVSDIALLRTDIEIDEEGEQRVGWVLLTYKVTYFSYQPESTDGLDNFDTADIRHSLANAVHVDNQAHDLLENLYTI
jgi:hypothetical protein